MSLGEALYAIVLYPIVQVIEVAYKVFSQLFSNTGIAIMGVSFVVTVLCLPLYIVAEKWQQLERDTQRRLKPGVDRIKAAFKGDEQYMILSTYYRQNHYHPMMALRSSFGLLIQVPFFMAAYSCLSSLPALQGQSFLFIRDMGAPDALFAIGGFSVNVLPIAMTLINIAAGAIYTKGFPFKEKAQIYGMALLFLVLLYNSPAGLVLYWTMNNVFSLVKNIFYKLKHPVKVLYILMCAGIILADIYILFIYGGSASMTKRLAAVIPFSCLLLAPLLIRGVNWLLTNKIGDFVYTPPPIKLRIFIPVALAWALLSGLVLPSSLIASSVLEFSDIGSFGNPAVFLWYSCFQSLGLFVFWPLCIFFLFKERVQTLLTIVFSMGLVCSVVNAFLFVVNYGPMDIKFVFFNGFVNLAPSYMILNVCILIVTVVLLYYTLTKFNGRFLSPICIVLILAFSLFGFINITSIMKDYSVLKTEQISDVVRENDIKPEFHFTQTGKNIVVIMLDKAAGAYFEAILQDKPELGKIFDGFKYYKNALAYNSSTLIATPGLYGGYEYVPANMNAKSKVLLKDKHNEALLLMPRILTEQSDFEAILADSSWGNYKNPSDMGFVENYDKIKATKLYIKYSDYTEKMLGLPVLTESLESAIIRNLLWMSLFRESPVVLREVIYYRGTYFNPNAVSDSDKFFDWYAGLYCLPMLTDFNALKNSFIMITNETTHQEFDSESIDIMDINSLSYPNSMHYKENVISLETIGSWFDLMKENQVYDNTRIIIVSDHGIGQGALAEKDYDFPYLDGFSKDFLHPLLLYKDFNATGEIQTDTTFMTTADVPTLVLEGIVENPINPFTGNSVNSSAKNVGVYVTTDTGLWSPENSKSEYIFTVPDDSWYHVKDNIFIDSNWTQEVPR